MESAVKEVLIVLSLLGCDDTGAQCHYLRAAPERFETVEACREASEMELAASAAEEYPTVVAMCAPDLAGAEPLPPESPLEAELQVTPEEAENTGFLGRIGAGVAAALPDRETVGKPVIVVKDGAVWVGNAVIVGVSRAAEAVNPF
jgi:hypothetical protein